MDAATALQFKAMGPCLKRGSEIWFIEGSRLKVASVLKVNESENTISVRIAGNAAEPEHTIKMNPEDKIIMSKRIK